VFNAVCGAAEKKATQDPTTTLALGFSAGALIGIGALLMSCIGAASPALATANPGLCNFLKGAVGLPAGLTLVILTGAELFTGNVMVMLSGFLTKKIDAKALLKNWVLSYAGNFIGSVVMAYLAFGAATAAAPAAKAAVIGIATTKASLPFAVAFFKGVLCNWLVCLAVWGTMASTSGRRQDLSHLLAHQHVRGARVRALHREHVFDSARHAVRRAGERGGHDAQQHHPRNVRQRLRSRRVRRGAPLLRVRAQVSDFLVPKTSERL
jgi:formate/nitrite transporter